jgi:hypothetical protein
MKNSTILKIDPYLATRMNERRAHVFVFVVSRDLLIRQYKAFKESVYGS